MSTSYRGETISDARLEKLVRRIDVTGFCWLVKTSKGHLYAELKLNNKPVPFHRFMYEWLTGKALSPEVTLDHLCRITNCVNPDHLEETDLNTNILRSFCASAINARKTHCKRGHEFNDVNTRFYPQTNKKKCLICESERAKAKRRGESY
jgi:hypothetical protein